MSRPSADGLLRLHAFEARSKANGPGTRAVAWLQGCTLGCPGCFNPETHDPRAGRPTTVAALLDCIRELDTTIEGVTLTGGEPFQQPEALLALLQGLRTDGRLSVLVFSGYTLDEIRARPSGRQSLELVDVLVAGRYAPHRHLGREMLGSANQQVHLLSDRHTIEEIAAVPTSEVIIAADGLVTITGVDPLRTT